MRAGGEDREDGVTRAAYLSVSAVRYTAHRAHREGQTRDTWTGASDIPGHGLRRKSGIKCVPSVTGVNAAHQSLEHTTAKPGFIEHVFGPCKLSYPYKY